jgi:hypothetical protein
MDGVGVVGEAGGVAGIETDGVEEETEGEGFLVEEGTDGEGFCANFLAFFLLFLFWTSENSPPPLSLF